MGEDEQFLAIRDLKLAEDAGEVMTHCNVTNGKPIRNILILQSQGKLAYDLQFAGGQALNLFRILSVGNVCIKEFLALRLFCLCGQTLWY